MLILHFKCKHMLFNLSNGKTIEISLEQYLSMSDEDIQAFTAEGFGNEIQDPFYGSSLRYDESHPVDPEEEDVEDIDDTLDYEEEI